MGWAKQGLGLSNIRQSRNGERKFAQMQVHGRYREGSHLGRAGKEREKRNWPRLPQSLLTTEFNLILPKSYRNFSKFTTISQRIICVPKTSYIYAYMCTHRHASVFGKRRIFKRNAILSLQEISNQLGNRVPRKQFCPGVNELCARKY